MVIRRLMWAITTPLSEQLRLIAARPHTPAPRYWVDHTQDGRFKVRRIPLHLPPLTRLAVVAEADVLQAIREAETEYRTVIEAGDRRNRIENGEQP